MRLIDADALIDNMRGCFIDNIEENIAVQIINSAPTIEPKRGEWMPYKRHKGETVLWKCSECGHTIYSETKTDRLAYHKWCGKCGADMRGEDDD